MTGPPPASDLIIPTSIPNRRRRPRTLLRILVALLSPWVALLEPPTAAGQYDWSAHLGPVPTGFEVSRFGVWDLEILPLRGMVDRAYYESDQFDGTRFRKIVETTRAAVGEEGRSAVFRHSTSHLDRSGRITRIEYADPLTAKVIQRELFSYDRDGRLIAWRRARPPSEISVASVTRTLYPGRGPYGMSQSWSYDERGTLREWHACTISGDQGLEQCEEDYLVFDRSGRIVEFGMTGTHYRIARNAEGNAQEIEIRGAEGDLQGDYLVSAEERVVVETPSSDSLAAGNVGWLDERGRIIQYRVSKPETPEYYWTATWTYDRKGRPVKIQKGFDTYDFRYDAVGRLIGVDQSRTPGTVQRTYTAQGRLHSQDPPLFYGRLDEGLAGEERYAYDDQGFLVGIEVRNTGGQPIAETELRYIGSRSD